jgi:PAP2 superfamily
MSPKKHDASGLSRRKFLGGAAAAALAAGSTGIEPLLPGGGLAEAAGGVGPQAGDDRLTAAMRFRETMMHRMAAAGMPEHVNNGDEDNLPGFIGNYSKGLAHNALGEVTPASYQSLMKALNSGSNVDFRSVILAGDLLLTNPQAGLAFDSEGLDPHQYTLAPAPAFSSAEQAGEMVEHYWQALLRDVPFQSYRSSPLAQAAADDINRLSEFHGLRNRAGRVTPATLFRDPFKGTGVGPYISQFLWLDTPFGVEFVDRRMRTRVPGVDFATTFDDWLALQNGNVPGVDRYSPQRRYMLTGRDLAAWVHIDVLFQAYFNACLILGTKTIFGGIEAQVNPGNPYFRNRREAGFATLGGPFFKTLLCEVSTRALKAVWFQKWFVHRRLRPEEFAGRVHVHSTGRASYPLHSDVLDSAAMDALHSKYGTYVLPLAFKEGCPTHPSYASGHSTVAGACVTILKAMFDDTYAIPHPKVPNADGTALVDLDGVVLTVGGELNKLASNVATGRNIAGVHWRTDAVRGILLGEQVALHTLVDSLACLNEDFLNGPLVFTSLQGKRVEVTKNGFTMS